jgi:archaemetzincin
VRRSKKLRTLYLSLVGEFTEPRRRVIDLTGDYLGFFFDCPVTVKARIPLGSIPERAKRMRSSGEPQLLTGYLLQEVLGAQRPDDALAYVALSASDLWPGTGWNFVYGQANVQDRTGVWSIYRNGDPGASDAAFRLCLRRTFNTASHEICHLLSMHHCTASLCLMNGSNHQKERDSRPLHLCPVCLTKLLWNLQAEPVPYLKRLQGSCKKNHFDDDAAWYERAIAVIDARPGAAE